MIGVIDWTGGTGEVKDVANGSAVESLANVKLAKFEARLVAEVSDIVEPASKQVIDGDDCVSIRQQGITEVRAEKARSPGYESS
jgi:hypothetical protein